jgi:hypothetical protein
MKILDLNEIERHPDTDQMVEALTAETGQVEWVQLFSANGKHAISARQDPGQSEDEQ